MLLRIVYKRVVTQKKGQPSHVMRTQQKARVGMYNSQGDTPPHLVVKTHTASWQKGRMQAGQQQSEAVGVISSLGAPTS